METTELATLRRLRASNASDLRSIERELVTARGKVRQLEAEYHACVETEARLRLRISDLEAAE
jgi:hypothetical protein